MNRTFSFMLSTVVLTGYAATAQSAELSFIDSVVKNVVPKKDGLSLKIEYKLSKESIDSANKTVASNTQHSVNNNEFLNSVAALSPSSQRMEKASTVIPTKRNSAKRKPKVKEIKRVLKKKRVFEKVRPPSKLAKKTNPKFRKKLNADIQKLVAQQAIVSRNDKFLSLPKIKATKENHWASSQNEDVKVTVKGKLLERIPYRFEKKMTPVTSNRKNIAKPPAEFNVIVEEVTGDIDVSDKPPVIHEGIQFERLNTGFIKTSDHSRKVVASGTIVKAQNLALKMDKVFDSNNTFQRSPFVARSMFETDPDVTKIKNHISQGGIVALKGTSGAVLESERIQKANQWVEYAQQRLISLGIDKSKVVTYMLGSYKSTNDKAGVTFALYKK